MSTAEVSSPRITVIPDEVLQVTPKTDDTGAATGPPEQIMRAEKSVPKASALTKKEEGGPPSLEADSSSHSVSAALSLNSEPQSPLQDDAASAQKLIQESKDVLQEGSKKGTYSQTVQEKKSTHNNESVDEILETTFASESEVVQTIPDVLDVQVSEEDRSLEAMVAKEWWPAHRWQEGAKGETGFLQVASTEGCAEQEVLRAPLEPFFVLNLPSPKTADFSLFPSLKSKDARAWDGQLLRRMQHLFPSLRDSLEAWLTSAPEWKLLASALFFMATCKSLSQTKIQAGHKGESDAERRVGHFSQCLGLEKELFMVQVEAAAREMREDSMKGEAFFYSTVLELGPKDAGWSARLQEAVNRRYKVGFTSATQNAEVLAFLRVAACGFQFVQNPLTAAHEALAYHPALACLRASVPRPKVFPRASAKTTLGCVEWFVEADSGLLVLYSNQRLERHDSLLWSSSRFLPFDSLNVSWTPTLANKVDETEAEQTHERQLLPLTLLFQTCRLSVFKPYHAFDHFITDPAEHAFSEATVQQLVAYALNPENMDLLRCKVPSLGTEIVQESLFASLYLRCCLYVCFAVWVHRKGVGSALAEMLRHHPAFAERWKQTGREAKNEVLRVLSKKRTDSGGAGSGRRHRSYAPRQKNGSAGAEFLADALLFALEDQFTELCFLLFPPQGSYLSDRLGNDVLLKFASLAQKCRLLRAQRLLGSGGKEEMKLATGTHNGEKYLFLEEVGENFVAKIAGGSETGLSERNAGRQGAAEPKKKFLRWGF